MSRAHGLTVRIALTIAALAGGANAAFAQAQAPTISGNGWVAIAVIVGLVVLIGLFISGALSLSRRDKSDEDEAGVGILEGIDEDDDKPKKKRK